MLTPIQSIESQMRNSRWREAQRACRALLFSRPTDSLLHAWEGLCFFRLGQFAAAEPCFMRASVLDPDFVGAGVKRCQCLERLGMIDEAVRLAREWSARRPNEPTLRALIHNYGNRPDPYRTDAWERTARRKRSVEFAA